jgi:hypothetical protein
MTTAYNRSLTLNDNSTFRQADRRRGGVTCDGEKPGQFPNGFPPTSGCLDGIPRSGVSAADSGTRAVDMMEFVRTLSDAELSNLVAEARKEQESRRAKKAAAFLAKVYAEAEALGLDSSAVVNAMAGRTDDARRRFEASRTTGRWRFARAR